MSDTLSPAARSERMSRIRSRDTKPEILLRKFLHAMGLRYKLHDRLLPGTPDLVFPRYHTVVQVYGCFWHRHKGCKLASDPKSNMEFWSKKFTANVERDRQDVLKLALLGWRVIIVWECSTNTTAKARQAAIYVADQLRNPGC